MAVGEFESGPLIGKLYTAKSYEFLHSAEVVEDSARTDPRAAMQQRLAANEEQIAVACSARYLEPLECLITLSAVCVDDLNAVGANIAYGVDYAGCIGAFASSRAYSPAASR